MKIAQKPLSIKEMKVFGQFTVAQTHFCLEHSSTRPKMSPQSQRGLFKFKKELFADKVYH
jgi:hypothetical protein